MTFVVCVSAFLLYEVMVKFVNTIDYNEVANFAVRFDKSSYVSLIYVFLLWSISLFVLNGIDDKLVASDGRLVCFKVLLLSFVLALLISVPAFQVHPYFARIWMYKDLVTIILLGYMVHYYAVMRQSHKLLSMAIIMSVFSYFVAMDYKYYWLPVVL